MTARQLERAELYVVAALDLEPSGSPHHRDLEDLRAHVAAVRRDLARPAVVRPERPADSRSQAR